MRLSTAGFAHQQQEGERRCQNSELWHACAGPLVSLPTVGSRVVYFPQGHSEQVTASTNREVDAQIPNYPSLPPQLICQLHNLTMHADVETDEVYAQMTLQPLSLQEQKDPYLPADMGVPSKQPANYFCKTLTASDTSTHGGFSVPRRAAEKVFPPLDFSQKPPVQELIARDLHDNEWKFRHIFRGQPKRHLLTTGWSVFVSAKRLVAGDSVLFIWNEKKQLLLGIRRANRPQTVMPSSVLSSDSMHLGLLAAAAHAAATNSHFTIFYNPRASPSEFVIPLVKYVKAVCQTQVSVGMRFRMLFETEESTVRRYMGTVTGIGDFDPSRWSNSHWRSVKVGWDESTAGERQPKVSLWEIEPLMTFPMYPPPFSLRLKRPWPTGFPSIQGMKGDDLGMKPPVMRLHGDNGGRGIPSLNFQGVGVTPWLQTDGYMLGLQTDVYQAMATSALQEMRANGPSKQATPFVRFQQPQNLPGRSACILQPKMLQQQPQPQSTFLQGIQENHQQVQSLSQPEFHILRPALQNQHSISTNSSINNSTSNSNNNNGNNNQQQTTGLAQPQQQEQLVDHPQVSSLVSSLSQFTSASPSHSLSLQMMPSLCYQQSFSDLNGISVTSPIISPLHSLLGSFPQDDPSHLFNLPQTNPLINSSISGVVEPLLPSGTTQCVLPPMEQLVPPQTNISQNSISLPPFPSRECSIDVEGSADPQGHLLFGVSIEPTSLLMQDGISGLGGICTENNSPSMSIPSSNFMSTVRSNFPLNPVMTPSNYIDETGFLQSPENMGQVNTQTRNFVKVHKLGSFGRSLDITKFSSYHELRGELARMFGLEGQLEDPLRSGWQLVFVDQENDVLLLGDGPWPEFVNSVWCIKILSPPEVQQMGGRQDLLNSVPIQKLFNSR